MSNGWGDTTQQMPSAPVPVPPPGVVQTGTAPTPMPAVGPTPQVEEFKGVPARGDGDNVYLLKGGKRYWITSSEIYTRLGFKFGDEVKLDQATLSVIPEGEPIR